MSKYRLVIFDLDGTILDTSEGILTSVEHTINQLGLPLLNRKEMLNFIGPPVQNSFAKYYKLSGTSLQQAADMFRDNYSKHHLLLAKPYEGIYEVFDYLRASNIQPAIATYKREDYAIKLLKYFKFDKYTDIMFGADNENKLTKADIIDKCKQKAQEQNLQKMIMIGDTNHDAIGAAEMGIDFLAVTYGFGFKNKDDLSGIKKTAIAKNPLEIIQLFIH